MHNKNDLRTKRQISLCLFSCIIFKKTGGRVGGFIIIEIKSKEFSARKY